MLIVVCFITFDLTTNSLMRKITSNWKFASHLGVNICHPKNIITARCFWNRRCGTNILGKLWHFSVSRIRGERNISLHLLLTDYTSEHCEWWCCPWQQWHKESDFSLQWFIFVKKQKQGFDLSACQCELHSKDRGHCLSWFLLFFFWCVVRHVHPPTHQTACDLMHVGTSLNIHPKTARYFPNGWPLDTNGSVYRACAYQWALDVFLIYTLKTLFLHAPKPACALRKDLNLRLLKQHEKKKPPSHSFSRKANCYRRCNPRPRTVHTVDPHDAYIFAVTSCFTWNGSSPKLLSLWKHQTLWNVQFHPSCPQHIRKLKVLSKSKRTQGCCLNPTAACRVNTDSEMLSLFLKSQMRRTVRKSSTMPTSDDPAQW